MNAIATVAPPMSVNDIVILARAFAKSGLFGMKTEDQAIALMMIAQAEGRHPAEAARDYDIIQGKPAKKAEAMLRDFIQAGGKVEWHELSDIKADATFSHPQTGSVRIDWDLARANTAGLGSKPTWKAFPRQMLRSRVVSEGVRTLWPLATSGMYVPEEQADIERKEEHNGQTIESTATDAREQMNRDVPLKPAAAATQRAERKVDPTVYAPPPGSTPAPERTDAQWRTWLDKLRAATEVLYRKEEVVELGNRASVGDAIASGPEWVRAEVSAILAENYARFPDEPADDLPEVEIAGERNVMAGDD